VRTSGHPPLVGMNAQSQKRPFGIAALSMFFLLGSLISLTAAVSLLLPGSFLQPIWRLNPRGHEGPLRIGFWAMVLLFAASMSCGTAAVGLWRRARWGHILAIVLIGITLLSDLGNSVLRTAPRAIVGVPIALAILLYLMSRRVRNYFAQDAFEST